VRPCRFPVTVTGSPSHARALADRQGPPDVAAVLPLLFAGPLGLGRQAAADAGARAEIRRAQRAVLTLPPVAAAADDLAALAVSGVRAA
jgi:hypothetical protein